MAKAPTPDVPSGDEKVPVTIKLSEVATSYIQALQRLFDYSSFVLGSTRLINETEYDEFSRSMGVMPANQSRLGYGQAKEETERWLLKCILGEALSVAVLSMGDCRTICALTNWKAAGGEDQGALQKILGDERREFDQAPLTDKFDALRKQFNVTTPFEDHLRRLIRLRSILAAKEGTIPEGEATDPDDTFIVKLKMVQLSAKPAQGTDPNSVTVSTQLQDAEKTFRKGESIRLTKQEHISTIITLSFFVTSLMQSVQEYGRKNGMGTTV